MRITIDIPWENVQRQNLQVGDGILVDKSTRVLERRFGRIVKIELTKQEKEENGGGFRAG